MKSINSAYRIVGIGELTWDVYPEGKYVGGSAANVVFHARQLGDQGILISRVGADADGKALVDKLQTLKIATDFIQVDPAINTGVVHITVDEQGNPQYRCSRNTAFDYLQLTEHITEISASADAVYFSLIAQRHPVARKTIHAFLEMASTAFKIFDLNIRKWTPEIDDIIQRSLTLANALKANEAEIRLLQQAWGHSQNELIEFITKIIKDFQLRLVTVTLGENGCLIANEQESITVATTIKSVLDTTGAGDAFTAAVIHQYLRQASLLEIAELGNQIAGIVAQHKGAIQIAEAVGCFDSAQQPII